MKLPRDVSGRRLGRALASFGYSCTRQKGSHMRFTTELHGQHHVTIPDSDPIRLGTLHGILRDIAGHHGVTMEQLLQRLKL